MPKHIPEATKLEAMTLFLEGNKTAREIANVISRDGVVVKPPTIYAWAKKEGWGEQQAVARSDQQQKLIESEGQRYSRLQKEQLESYTTVATKGFIPKCINDVNFTGEYSEGSSGNIDSGEIILYGIN